ncbi:MAG: hypothetical protein WBQ10_03475, partial [Terriglobales bacterium]
MRICTNVTELFQKGPKLLTVNFRNRNIFSYISLAVLCVAGCSSDLWAQEMTLELDPANTKVEFT